MSILELSKKLVEGAVPANGLDGTPVAEPALEPKALKVLIVDGCWRDLALTEAVLRHVARFEPTITSVSTLKAARFALGADAFDVLVVCADVGGECGLDLVAEAGAQVAGIVLTGAATAQLKADALEKGAVAVFAKSFLSPKRIEAAILDRAVRTPVRGRVTARARNAVARASA